jgi:hypothetical protein
MFRKHLQGEYATFVNNAVENAGMASVKSPSHRRLFTTNIKVQPALITVSSCAEHMQTKRFVTS